MDQIEFSNLTFLIAEDSRFKISLLRQQLRAFEAGKIIECLDGAEAFDALCAKKVDFVITDSSMSPVDGLTLVRQIRTNKLSPNPEVPVIVLVENPDLTSLTSARDVGATEVLSKPVSATLLCERIQFALKNNRNFVKADEFVGPDRRRRRATGRKAEERRQL